jgi:gliding motility-associated protein GldC
MLSVWDSKAKESMRIDLWTKEMPVDEMKIFFHQTLGDVRYFSSCHR